MSSFSSSQGRDLLRPVDAQGRSVSSCLFLADLLLGCRPPGRSVGGGFQLLPCSDWTLACLKLGVEVPCANAVCDPKLTLGLFPAFLPATGQSIIRIVKEPSSLMMPMHP